MILVIDDFEPQRFVRKRQLEAAGFRVCDVGSVAAARQVVASESVRVVLSDIGLNDGNGIAFCAELKRQRPALPVVLVSATYRTSEIRRDALAAGAAAILTDPLSADQLVRVIRQVWGEDAPQEAAGALEVWTDVYGAITDISPVAAEALNVSVRHCLGRKMHLFFANNRTAVMSALSRVGDGHVETFASTIRPRDMRPISVTVTMQPSHQQSGIYWQLTPVGDAALPRRTRSKRVN